MDEGPLEHFDKGREASWDIAMEEKMPGESLDLGRRGQTQTRWKDAEGRQALLPSAPGPGVQEDTLRQVSLHGLYGWSDSAGVSRRQNVRVKCMAGRCNQGRRQ